MQVVRTKNACLLPAFDFGPYPSGMRSKTEGLSHGLKTGHRTVFTEAPASAALSSPIIVPKSKIPLWGILDFGAADGTRTRTVSLPGDFKSPVSTDSTTAAFHYHSIISPDRQAYNWSRFKVNASKQLSRNQSSSGRPMAFMASQVCFAAVSNSVFPAFCSSRHLI